jgi:2'-hydroxyisoflavone reductase
VQLLLIGGPSFIGLHTIRYALAAGHDVTMFNRGRTNPDAFPEVERLRGDRTSDEDLQVLRGRTFDAVVDTCGFDNRVVQKTLDVLDGNVGHYTFISSVSVYADYSAPRQEDDELERLEADPDVPLERAYGGSAHYGPLKVLCEQAVERAFPGRSVKIRLTLGAGPDDHGRSTHRMAYWAQRVRDHDSVLVPGPASRLVNFIDVRDMTEFIVRQAERGGSGPFNLAAPALPIVDFLTLFKGIYDTDAELVFADPEWLLEQGVRPNTELPWWIPGEGHDYHFAVDGNKAIAEGLRLRPLGETIRDSVEWADAHPALADGVPIDAQAGSASGPRPAFLSRERELELIEAWRRR